jgi:hypothetical protein
MNFGTTKKQPDLGRSKDKTMNLNDAVFELRKLHLNNDETKLSFLEIKHAALMVAKAADHEAMMAELKSLNDPFEQQSATMDRLLSNI